MSFFPCSLWRMEVANNKPICYLIFLFIFSNETCSVCLGYIKLLKTCIDDERTTPSFVPVPVRCNPSLLIIIIRQISLETKN